MKEAIGEANLSSITIILIGAMIPVFMQIIPRLTSSIADRACCISNDGEIRVVSGETRCYVNLIRRKDSSGKYYDAWNGYAKLKDFDKKFCKKEEGSVYFNDIEASLKNS